MLASVIDPSNELPKSLCRGQVESLVIEQRHELGEVHVAENRRFRIGRWLAKDVSYERHLPIVRDSHTRAHRS